MDIFIQQCINAIIIGCFYSLIALGYTMVFGVIRLLNFAHGDIFMVGSFVGFTVLSFLTGMPSLLGLGLALLISMVVIGLFGVVVERIAYRPLFNASSRLAVLITAVGVSLFLQNGIMLTYGASFRVYPIHLSNKGFHILGVNLSYMQLGIIIFSIFMMVALHIFIHKTLYGKAMRSIAINSTATSLMGIAVHRVIAMTFFIGSSLAAAAGVMDGVYYGQINFLMGFIIGLKAFTAAVIGGIGSVKGAMLGGLLLGIVETIGTVYVGSAWKDVFAFGILILLLVFKPTGILGENEVERV
ncbi:branched-chain amino acid ABC transporter permease [Bacillus salipaludis]|uniref:branched-chain amino acid ABC transporter permease n=1 Tax=Bacillus salipaludis TaxID=2547811 RepID=UPI003D2522CB